MRQWRVPSVREMSRKLRTLQRTPAIRWLLLSELPGQVRMLQNQRAHQSASTLLLAAVST